MLNLIGHKVSCISKFATELKMGNGFADVLLVHKNNKRAAIFELKYTKSATFGLNQAIEKQYGVNISKQMETILIGLNVSLNKSVKIDHLLLQKDEILSSS